MDATRLGLGLAGLGVVGYAVGVVTTYPGRALSIAAVMIGLTLTALEPGGDTRGGDG